MTVRADEIESKDFSIPQAIHGMAHILEGIGSDLERINDALYPANEPPRLRKIRGGNV